MIDKENKIHETRPRESVNAFEGSTTNNSKQLVKAPRMLITRPNTTKIRLDTYNTIAKLPGNI